MNLLILEVSMANKLLAIFTAILVFVITSPCFADENRPPIKVGVVSILTGDLSVIGDNVVPTVKTYEKNYLRHNIKFSYEDAKLSSVDGLKAYQRLINAEKVDLIIGACTSNGTMAATALINSSKTPTITIVTGGQNIDKAGPYIFRVGNSDTLNGYQEAEVFIKAGQKNIALLAEQTEYTQDIAKAFREKFRELGGNLVFDKDFVPGTSDFRTEVSLIKKSNPAGIFMPTQTGTALGIFLKQWHEQGGTREMPIHTTFVAAPNPDAHAVAGELLEGVYYMAPVYDKENSRLGTFVKQYFELAGHNPQIMFHTAGTVDVLDLLQAYLDQHSSFSREGFKDYLLTKVKNYSGMMGNYSFDAEGNADLGFSLTTISKEDLQSF